MMRQHSSYVLVVGTTIICILCATLSNCVYNTSAKLLTLNSLVKADAHTDAHNAIETNDLRYVVLLLNGICYANTALFSNEPHRLITETSHFDDNRDYETTLNDYAIIYNANIDMYKKKRHSQLVARGLAGYGMVTQFFTFSFSYVGNFSPLLSDTFYYILEKSGHCTVDSYVWHNPVSNSAPVYNWNDYLSVVGQTETTTAKHSWIENWKHASTNRHVKMCVYGTTPNDRDATYPMSQLEQFIVADGVRL